MVLDRIEIDPNVFTVTSPVNELEYDIISMSDQERVETLDLTSSFLIFDYMTTVLIFISVLFFIIIKKILTPTTHQSVALVGSFFSQSYSKLMKFGRKCLITIIWLYFTFSIIHFITGNFKTNLVQKYPAKRIETIADLAVSSIKPIFMQYFPVMDLFKTGYSKDYERVWLKCKDKEESCILYNEADDFEKQFKSIIDQEKALINFHKAQVVFNGRMCRKFWKANGRINMKRVSISKPFLRKTFSLIMNHNVTKPLKDRLNVLLDHYYI